MRKAAVICEFNPFHNGHKFLLKKVKPIAHPAGEPSLFSGAVPHPSGSRSDGSSIYQREPYCCADEVVCIMSGSFVQRGDIAITDKFTRAQAALNSGADMVVELPTVWAMSSAQVFASNGVRIAHELGCDTLCFGSENSLTELYEALDVLDAEDTKEKIAQNMRSGSYYPRALSEAVGAQYAGIVSKPNNILALEYIRACRTYDIEPAAIPRTGADHDSGRISGDIASATKIRELILSGKDYTPYTPMRIEHPATIDAIDSAVMYRLKTISADELACIGDVGEGLENRIIDAAKRYNSYSELLSEIKTKRYTMARLRRITLSALLGITRDLQSLPVPYIRVLGVRPDKKHLISSRSLPLIVDVKSGYDRLDNSVKEIFNIDLKSAELMNIAAGSTINEFSHGLITKR